MNLTTFWKEKTVLITGVCGTVGSEVLRQLVSTDSSTHIVGIDNNESELFFLSEEYRDYSNVKLFFGDIRDPEKLLRKSRGVNYVIHAAALKHVILCEHSPRDAVQTNIVGTQNVIDAALANRVERVIFTSSDKAVNPTNVMGTTKLMGERLITAANAHRRTGGTFFSSTRFGNVLGSRGSVVPLFKRQIAARGPVTLTAPEMTRFIMTLSDAVKLVMNSAPLARGGEVFVTKMPIARIVDLARVMIEELAPYYGYQADEIPVKIIGSKPGEKLYEELMNHEETRRTVELEDYFVVKPAFSNVYENADYTYENTLRVGVDTPYNSSVEKPMSLETLRTYLQANNLLHGGE